MAHGARPILTRTAALGAALLLLLGCSQSKPETTPGAEGASSEPRYVAVSPIPQPNPLEPPAAVPIREVPLASSEELAQRYDRFEGSLVSQGYLREDRGSMDALGPDQLATNFLRIALYDEYTPVDGGFRGGETASRLRRWEGPVRFSLMFGKSVPEPQRASDSAEVDSLVRLLADTTGHPVSRNDSNGNFSVFVVDERERLALGPTLKQQIPGITNDTLVAVLDILPNTFCLVLAFSSPEQPWVYARAMAIIRAEHPPRLRRACFHEEIAQGMGLPNDSDAVRPSVFNDDEEFALLTDHDLLLLRILYDGRLRPGMDLTEAAPVVAAISKELLGTDIAALH